MSGVRSILKALRAATMALAAASILSAAAPIPPASAAPQTAKKQRLSATRYFTLAPFTLPLFDGDEVTEQMTIVVALELTDDEQREEVSRMVPKIRDVMYRVLYNMVTFRRRSTPLPDVDQFKVRLYRVVRVVAGEKRVKALLVQQAFKRPAR